MVVTDIHTAELIKYAANAFLATKVSFINEMANLCEAVGADVHVVAKAMGLDRRIGSKFLHPGPGYGARASEGQRRAGGLLAPVRRADADRRGHRGRERGAEAARGAEDLDALAGKGPHTVAILGLSFKPDTDDLRAAPSLDIIRILLRAGFACARSTGRAGGAAGIPRAVEFAPAPTTRRRAPTRSPSSPSGTSSAPRSRPHRAGHAPAGPGRSPERLRARRRAPARVHLHLGREA